MPAPNANDRATVRTDYLPFGRPDFSEEEIVAVTRVRSSGWVGKEPDVIAFEQELASLTEAPQAVHYPPLHQMEFYNQSSQASVPTTERIANSMLTLPISANMTLSDADDFRVHRLHLLVS